MNSRSGVEQDYGTCRRGHVPLLQHGRRGRIDRRKDYIEALDRLWDDVVGRCITGGIGSSRQRQGSPVHDLPNYEAYCETCASVGMVLWNCRMHQLTGDSNTPTCWSDRSTTGHWRNLTGRDRFFYVKLASRVTTTGRSGMEPPAVRADLRFLPSVGNYIYGVSGDALWVNLYIGQPKIDLGKRASPEHRPYPWDGKVEVWKAEEDASERDAAEFPVGARVIRLR